MPVPGEITIAKIDSIAALTEPVLRNVLITQCYCELSSVFATHMAAGANWCTFATWASKQAGLTIRHEDLEHALENILKNVPEIEIALSLVITLAKQSGAQQSLGNLRDSVVGTMVSNAASHAADAVSRGNKKVFEEIAREFSRFIMNCLPDIAYNKSHIDDFCRQLKPGLPPDGQDYLAKGFSYYYRALFELDSKKRVQLNLLGNLFIGYHEQNRLQPEIAEALNASIDAQQIKSELLDKLFKGSNWWIKFRLFFKRVFGFTLLDNAIEASVQLIQKHLRMALTAHLMTITLPPDNYLHLGRDLSMTFSEDLKELTDADLIALLKQVDPTPGSVLESGATDWANLAERMHYIADMFRCYHQSKELFDPAFTAAQVEAMKNGRLPEGRL
ncbi:MAG: hypothetical protein JWP81_4363 [Ferruginibacter sp.]|nr:hypothetical protein [Ferruginibacter sp.]